MRRPADRLRVARTGALLALGSLVVHQLRYLIAFGAESGAELHREGHEYLSQSLPVLLALAGAAIAARLLVGAASAAPGSSPASSTWSRAVRYGLAIVCVFSVQELAEGMLAPAHPAGLFALVGGGAWVAAPLALMLGLVAAGVESLLDRAEAIIATAWGREATRVLDPTTVAPAGPAPQATPLAARALAFGFARRPPPAIAVS